MILPFESCLFIIHVEGFTTMRQKLTRPWTTAMLRLVHSWGYLATCILVAGIGWVVMSVIFGIKVDVHVSVKLSI